MEIFNLKKLSELEFWKECQNKISKRLAALHILKDSEDINKAWENIKGDIKILAKESLDLCERKQHKPCSHTDQRKQAKVQGLLGQMRVM